MVFLVSVSLGDKLTHGQRKLLGTPRMILAFGCQYVFYIHYIYIYIYLLVYIYIYIYIYTSIYIEGVPPLTTHNPPNPSWPRNAECLNYTHLPLSLAGRWGRKGYIYIYIYVCMYVCMYVFISPPTHPPSLSSVLIECPPLT